jgi:hypothetical protein
MRKSRLALLYNRDRALHCKGLLGYDSFTEEFAYKVCLLKFMDPSRNAMLPSLFPPTWIMSGNSRRSPTVIVLIRR